MNNSLAGKKRPRTPQPTTNVYYTPTISYQRQSSPHQSNQCHHCEYCTQRHQELIDLKIQINDRINELNRLLESINYRFNEKGSMLTYIS